MGVNIFVYYLLGKIIHTSDISSGIRNRGKERREISWADVTQAITHVEGQNKW